MTAEPAEALRTVGEYLAAVQSGDDDRLRELYAPGATIWLNDGAGDRDVEAMIEKINAVRSAVRGFRLEILRRTGTADGGVFVQQVLHGERADGQSVALDVALYFRLDGAGVTRVEEYFDSATLGATRGARVSP